MKILLIDDSQLSRKMIRSALGNAYEFMEASNGGEGIEKYIESRPDLVVLDVIMPDMNGLDVLTELHRIDPQVKVILGTADIQPLTWEEGRKLGAMQIINKPFNPEDIRSAIDNLINQMN